jgi:excisionase family DNA binding protein
MVPKDVMTVQEASEYLAMEEGALARLAAERRIPSLEHDGQWLFSRKSIDKWRGRQGVAG